MLILPTLIPLIFIPQFTSNKISRKNYEAQLYEDLLFDYNRISRPVKNSTDVLHIDDEKNQVLTTNLWLEMRWSDARLQWDPNKYGGIRQLHIPSTDIWIPDFVLYDNAAGDPDITIFTDALISYNGRVYWQPPAIYKSFCPIKVKWFPYDKQDCRMKFGAWSYTGNYVDLHLIQQENSENINNKINLNKKREEDDDIEYNEMGMDLSFFYKSAEWDLMNLTSARHAVLYTSCCGPETYVDITYYLELRRKTLFFTCNLIVPCFLISFLTTFVFYLPDHKITFSISILVTLTVFFLVLIDLMPPTSLEVPMFGQYLITTMILVALSTLFSVASVNIRFRNGSTHQMSPWIRIVFLGVLPKILLMKRPERQQLETNTNLINNFMGETRQGLAPSSSSSSFNFEYSNKKATISSPSNLFNNRSKLPQTSIVNKNKKEKYDKPPPYSSITTTNTHKNSDKNNNPKEKNFLEENIYAEPSTSREIQQQFCSNKNQKLKKTEYTWNEQRVLYNLARQNNCILKRFPEKEFRNTILIESFRKIQEQLNYNFRKINYNVHFIANYFQQREEDANISNDWTFVAMVLDRFFLLVFSILNMATFSIIISAPTLFDFREPLNITVPTRPLGQAYLFSVNEE
uniref:Uncharacterized protein n=2 Tax=Meloidogyne TaxID=189290 RepID=A0A914MTE0_MELIC